MKIKNLLQIALLIVAVNNLSAKEILSMRKIKIIGLVMDSYTFSPLEGVGIYNQNEEKIGTTDARGFYSVEINYLKAGEIKFELKLKKENYDVHLQREHWGDLNQEINSIMYFGLQSKSSNSQGFSRLIGNQSNLTYENVNEKFTKLGIEIKLNKKFETARQNNENIFIQIDNSYYIMSETGWIAINSENDLISIDDSKYILAKEINNILKRNEVVGMTPLSKSKAQFLISTKN